MWHSFKRRKLNIIVPVSYYFTPYNKKTIGTDFLSILNVENGWQHQYVLEKHFKKAGDFLFQKLKKNSSFTKNSRNQREKIGKEFLMFCRKNLKKGLSNKTNRELAGLLDKYFGFYEMFSVANVTLWMFLGERLSGFLMEKTQKIGDNNKDFLLLSTPNVLSYAKQEELDVLSTAIAFKKNSEKVSEKSREVKKLADQYFYIPFDYLGPDILDEKHYAGEIKKLLKLDIDSLEEKKEAILSYQKDLEKKQKERIRGLKLSQYLVNLFEAMKDIAVLQDEKKSVTTESHYYLQGLYKEMARRLKVNYYDFYLTLVNETKEMLLRGKKMKPVVEERKKLSVSVIENTKLRVICGQEARDYARKNNIVLFSDEAREDVKEIIGIPVSPGKARGKARVLLSAKEIGRLKKGEILVATMTTPDYVPAMKRAAAIVTDEGGITCHAAIASREIGIPCVIGTRMATKALKDGDQIEVNADKGIVRIFEK